MREFLEYHKNVARLQVYNDKLSKQLKELEEFIKEDFFLKLLAKLDEPARIKKLNTQIADLNKTVRMLKAQRLELRKDNKKLREEVKR